MLKIDKKYLQELEKKQVEKIFLYFYDAGCSGKKLQVLEDDFEKKDLTLALSSKEREQYGFDIFIKPEEQQYFESATIRKTVTADHTGKQKVRFIYVSDEVKDRCGCGSSFGFEKKVPKINLEKLKDLKNNFRIWK